MRVRWALEELSVAYDVQLLTFTEMKQPVHLARNPFGQIPTWQEGDRTLFESGAIVLHLAEQHPGLLPRDPDARMRAIMWMFAALNTVEPPIVERSMAWVLEREQPWYAQRLPMLDERVRARLAQLSTWLAKAPWLDGDFSVGDLMMVSVLLRLKSSGLLDEYPTVAAYVARATQRPPPTSAPSPRSWRCSRTGSSTPCVETLSASCAGRRPAPASAAPPGSASRSLTAATGRCTTAH
jgi:glutathione S-transferase